MKYLILLLLLCGCAQQQVHTGEHKLYTTIKVVDDWCYMPNGSRVYGFIEYSTKVKSISNIYISLKSDDPERTLRHELEHAGRNAIGLEAKWDGHL
jgi:hypothetical protein